MRRNGIGCLGMLLVGGAIIGAISSFAAGQIGWGWFFVVAAFVLPWPIGGAMLRADTAEHGALSAPGRGAMRQLERAMEARRRGDSSSAIDHLWSAMDMAPSMRLRGDWAGLVMLHLTRYAALRADRLDEQAAMAMAEWRADMAKAPPLMRGRCLAIAAKADASSSSVLARIADGTADVDGFFGDVIHD